MDSSDEDDTEEDQDLYDPISNLEQEQILIRVSPGNVAVLDVPDRVRKYYAYNIMRNEYVHVSYSFHTSYCRVQELVFCSDVLILSVDFNTVDDTPAAAFW